MKFSLIAALVVVLAVAHGEKHFHKTVSDSWSIVSSFHTVCEAKYDHIRGSFYVRYFQIIQIISLVSSFFGLGLQKEMLWQRA